MTWKSLFRKFLFLPVILILSAVLCRADAAIQFLNKVTESVSVPVYSFGTAKTPETFIKIEAVNKSPIDKSLVDLNKAAADELDLLPGLGKIRAEAIIIQRTKMGGFYSVDDVLCTPGIGPKIFSRFKNKVTVSK